MDPQKKKRRSPARPLRRFAMVLAALLVVMAGVFVAMPRNSVPLTPTATLPSPFSTPPRMEMTAVAQYNMSEARQAILAVVGVLPESAGNLGYAEGGIRDFSAWIRFDVSPAELPAWLQTAQRVCPDLQPDYMPTFQPQFGMQTWWRPEIAETGSGQSCHKDQAFYYIFVDTTNPDIWTVYLEIFLN